MKKIFAVIFVVMTITACNPRQNNPTGTEVHGIAIMTPQQEATNTVDGNSELTDLMGTRWILFEIEGQPPLPETLISLQITPEYFSGSAGCNRYSAEFTANSARSFVVEEIAINEEDCSEPEGVMEQENHYIRLLITAKTHQSADQELHLWDEQGRMILSYRLRQEFEVSPEDFADKTWQLISATNLDTENFSEFTLKFVGSTFSGTTACRDYEGTYQAANDTFQVTMMGMTSDEGCSQFDAHAEAQYTTLLENVEQYNVVSDRLELFTRRGEILIFELASE